MTTEPAEQKRPARVILESPFASRTPELAEIYKEYARRCMRDSLERGEAPMVSHLLYTQVLDDKKSEERTMGIEAGLVWGPVASYTVVYSDFGISEGMRLGIERAERENRPVRYRTIACPDLHEQETLCRQEVLLRTYAHFASGPKP